MAATEMAAEMEKLFVMCSRIHINYINSLFRLCDDNYVHSYCQMEVTPSRMYPFITYAFDEPVQINQLWLWNW
jgi:hypothetical protein